MAAAYNDIGAVVANRLRATADSRCLVRQEEGWPASVQPQQRLHLLSGNLTGSAGSSGPQEAACEVASVADTLKGSGEARAGAPGEALATFPTEVMSKVIFLK